jgi:hypothetical protein
LGETPSAFALDQGPQCLPNKGALLGGPRQTLRFEDEIVVQSECGSHGPSGTDFVIR